MSSDRLFEPLSLARFDDAHIDARVLLAALKLQMNERR
jgi:hypothetical protein